MANADNSLRPMRPIQRTPFVEEILPVSGAPDLRGGDKASHKHPCRGYGMNKKERAAAYAHRFKELQREWPHLTAHQRYTQLHTLANQQLAADGVPKVKMMQSNFADPGQDGEMDQQAWALNINQALIQTPILPPDKAQALAETVYHETRHAEQWYLVARAKAAHLQATTHLTPDQQVDEIGREVAVPPYVASAAQKHPLPHDSPQSACAHILYDSICGKNAGHRARTLTRLKAVDAMLPQAAARAAALNAAYERSLGAGLMAARPLTPAQQAAFDKADKAAKYLDHLQQEQPVLYQEYRNLPEEADAFETEGKAEKAWQP